MTRQTNHTSSLSTNCRYWGIALIALFTCLIPSQDILAQDLGGGGQIDTGGIDQLQQLGNGGGGVGGGVGGADGLGSLNDDVADLLTGGDFEDLRNQGFVGATGTSIQERGFVGPPGENSGPPIADGGSFGGGVNNSTAGGGGGGFGGGGNAGGNQSGFGALGGQVKGFQVIRKGVRTSLSPRFAAPAYSTNEISNRFNNRIRRQPVISNDGGGLFVSINNRVATVTGFAQTEAQRSRFIRQLRLEPGIDRINDQTSR